MSTLGIESSEFDVMKNKIFSQLVKNDTGAALIEYSLIGSILTLATIGSIGFYGGQANTLFLDIREAMIVECQVDGDCNDDG